MPWLSELLHRKAVDGDGRVVGRVDDVLAGREQFPRVTGILIRGRGGGYYQLPSVSFESGGVKLTGAPASESPPDTDVKLKVELLDRQIVDTDGARVVRVNDILLAESSAGMRVIGADVGLGGILRQLGMEKVVRGFMDALGYGLKERLIAWNYVAPLDEEQRDVRLTISTRILRELHPSELADILDQMDADKRERILSVMSAAQLAKTLPEAEPEVSREAVERMADYQVRTVLELMPPDEAADMLGDIGYERAERLLALMGVGQASVLRELLGYPPDTAGGRMTPSFVAIPRDSTAAEAIQTLRDAAREAETINYAYVLNENRELLGVLSLRALLRSPPDRPIEEIMEREIVFADVDDDQESVARLMAKYDLLAVPVVEASARMRGIITVDDVVDVMEEEASEDLAEVAGVYLGQGKGVAAGRLAGFGLSLAAGLVAALLLRAQRPVLLSIAAMAWLLPPYLRSAQDLGTWSLARALRSSNLSPRRQADALVFEMLAALAGSALTGVLVGIGGALLTGDSGAGVVMGVGIFVGSLAASLIGLGLPSLVRALKLHGLLARGRPLQVVVGLSGLIVYVWALGSLAARL